MRRNSFSQTYRSRQSRLLERLAKNPSGLLPDQEIIRLCRDQGMIAPYEEAGVRYVDSEGVPCTADAAGANRVVSYGPSSYGYDIRLSTHFKIFTNTFTTLVDPKKFNNDNFIDIDASEVGYIDIPPNSFALAESLETISVPRNCLITVLGKSTYARCGIIVNVTPLEPEWTGTITMEFSNTTPLPARLYAREGCAQLLVFRASSECKVSYADKGGKYQGQSGITLPKM